MVLKIGITGNIASGKSQLENILKEHGYLVYDTDKIAHDFLDEITDFYGYDVFTGGKIDRKKLGALVFKNKELKNKLEALIHPKVRARILEIFEEHKNEKYVFISVPLMYETGFDKLFDKIILVTVDKDIQIRRLMKRNNLSEEEALQRIASQLPQEQKINLADYIIENNSTKEDLLKRFFELTKVL